MTFGFIASPALQHLDGATTLARVVGHALAGMREAGLAVSMPAEIEKAAAFRPNLEAPIVDRADPAVDRDPGRDRGD